MIYDARTKRLQVDTSELDAVARDLRSAIFYLRRSAQLPPEGYSGLPYAHTEREGEAMHDADVAESVLLGLARRLSIDLGADRTGELNVTDAA